MRRLLAVLVLLSGCDLYFNGDDEPPCAGDGYGAYPEQQIRNPQTGQCESYGGWGGCYDSCGPCPEYAALSIALPDWGSCYSQCESLDEHACISTPGCLAAYDEYAPEADAPSSASFKGCWATAPSGPVQGGGCWNLDAQECSRHDDCSMFYTSYGKDTPTPALVAPSFSRCAPEPTANGCSTVDCGPGSHCEEQCYACDGQTGPCDPVCQPMCVPDGASCAAVDCAPGYECVEVCDQMDPTTTNCGVFPGQCYPTCVPVNGGGDPGECTGPVNCFANPPACPANTVPGIRNGCWTGYCIPENDCGPNDPGTCDPAICAVAGPGCPAGTTPGVKNGCYTGYCIPDASCPAPSCESLTTEAQCTQQAACTPVYTGDDCTCYPGGCSCETLVFDRCETLGVMPF